jgi:hypothetical protein
LGVVDIVIIFTCRAYAVVKTVGTAVLVVKEGGVTAANALAL